VHLSVDCNIVGEIFDAWYISATHISAPIILKVVVNANILICSKLNIFWELRCISLRHDKHQNFPLQFSMLYFTLRLAKLRHLSQLYQNVSF
jgi:hypothetical protein